MGANSNAVADYALTLMLTVARQGGSHRPALPGKGLEQDHRLDLYGKTLGIVGLGAIGQMRGPVGRAVST